MVPEFFDAIVHIRPGSPIGGRKGPPIPLTNPYFHVDITQMAYGHHGIDGADMRLGPG